jgi:hypothetical protein
MDPRKPEQLNCLPHPFRFTLASLLHSVADLERSISFMGCSWRISEKYEPLIDVFIRRSPIDDSEWNRLTPQMVAADQVPAKELNRAASESHIRQLAKRRNSAFHNSFLCVALEY